MCETVPKRPVVLLVKLLIIVSIFGQPSLAQQALIIGGSGTDLATMRQLASSFSKERPEVSIQVLPSIGTSGGIKAVLAGELDVALASRTLKPAEIELGVRALFYAKTPLVFAVSSDHPHDNISREQLIGIYAGNVTRWPDGTAARPILRPESDSDTLIFKSLSPTVSEALAKAYRRRGVPVAITDQDSADLIAAVPGALGTSTLALILGEKRPLKALALDGIIPTPAALSDGSYTLSKPLYFVTRPNPPDPARAFIRFVVSDHGAHILYKTGHLVEDGMADDPK